MSFLLQNISSDIDQASSTLTVLREMIKKYKQELIPRTSVSHEDMIKKLQIIIDSLSELHQKWQTIFMWQDGPLVHAMKNGDLFLVDEISLAEDSVIERLNSVLETERTLVSCVLILLLVTKLGLRNASTRMSTSIILFSAFG